VTTHRVWRITTVTVWAIAALIALPGCGGANKDPTEGKQMVAVASLTDVQRQVREQANTVLADLGLPPPSTAPDIGPAPCSDAGGSADDGRFYVAGAWQVPLPSAQQIATLRRVRDTWQAKGYEITDYRELPSGVEVVLAAGNPTNGYSLSLITTSPPIAVAMLVSSPCMKSPDGKYPG
jgi:hypothetical protein